MRERKNNGIVKRPFPKREAQLVERYLADVGKTPLLTAGQELELAKRIAKGDQDAFKAMVKANLRLVISVAIGYLNRGLSLPDLIQHGNRGLMKGIEKFDYTKGFKLSTYAVWWIRQALVRATGNEGRTIRLPIHTVNKVYRVLRAIEVLTSRNGAKPSEEMLADYLCMSQVALGEILTVGQIPLSIETPMGDDDDSGHGETLERFLADQSQPSVLDQVIANIEAEQLHQAMAELSEREQAVLKSRFGIGDSEEVTLSKIGRMFNISRERVRQIEAEALIKLRRKIESKRNKVGHPPPVLEAWLSATERA